MKNNDEVTLGSGIKITSGTIKLGDGNIPTKGFVLKSAEHIREKCGSPVDYLNKKRILRRRG